MNPHELAYKYLVSPVKALVAIELESRGYSQTRISKLLGVTQPMVSRYCRAGRRFFMKKLARAGVGEAEAEALVKMLSDTLAYSGRMEFIRVLSLVVNSIMSRQVLCSLHRRIDRSIPGSCSLCVELFAPPKDYYVEEVRSAFSILESCSEAYKLIPEVGSNIVIAKPGAKSIWDTVGFAGRIVRVGNKVVALGDPVYGGSRYTAKILLIVHSKWRSIRAVFPVRMEKWILESMRKLGYRILEVGPHEKPEESLNDIARAVSREPRKPDVIADYGGVGLEPIIYVLAPTAQEAVSKALEALRVYVK